MIFVVDRRNREAFSDQLEAMFRLRHRIYVKQRGWKALARSDGREIDQFDTEDAVYLLGLDDDGQITAGMRLIPTLKPHLMRDVFSHLVIWGRVPSDPKIYEATRCFVVETKPGERSKHAAGEIFCAAFEYGLSNGLSHISLVCDAFFISMMLENGWGIRPLGLPVPYDEGTCIAVLIEVSARSVFSTRAQRRMVPNPLVFSPTPPPFARPELYPLAA